MTLMVGSAPDGGDQPEREEITVAELLGRAGTSRSRPVTAPASSPRRKVAVTAGAALAVGSVVATAALFGHIDRSWTGANDPEQHRPGSGAPEPPRSGGLPGVGDRINAPEARAPLPIAPPARPARAAKAKPSRSATTIVPPTRQPRGSTGAAEVTSGRSAPAASGSDGVVGGVVRIVGDAVHDLGDALGSVGGR